jgi:hypothetical protein
MAAIFGCLISQATFASSQEEMASAYQERVAWKNLQKWPVFNLAHANHVT